MDQMRIRIQKNIIKQMNSPIQSHKQKSSRQPQNSSSVASALKQMTLIFKELIKKQVKDTSEHQTRNSFNKKQTQNIQENQTQNVFLEPRDKYVNLKLPKFKPETKKQYKQGNTKKKNKKEDVNTLIIKQWISQLCKASISTSFNYYFEDKMTYEQAKLFCSQCILRNIIRLHTEHPLTASDLENINQQMSQNIYAYMGLRYPMIQEIVINKELQKRIKQIDNVDTIENDLFWKTGIKFQLRNQTQNYNDLIMKVLNYVIQILNKQKETFKGNTTIFKEFQAQMTKIFESIYYKQKKKKVHFEKQHDDNKSEKKSGIDFSLFCENPKNNQNKEGSEIQQNNPQNVKNLQSQNQKIRQYTQFLIGRKVSQNVASFSQAQIQSNHLVIKNPAILRLLTKWCQQLWKKIQTPNYFLNRSQPYIAGGEQVLPDLKTKQILNKYCIQQRQKILTETKHLLKSNYKMQSQLLSRQISSCTSSFLNFIQQSYGRFTQKETNVLHNYIITYLNRLIHGLLTIAQATFNAERNRTYNTVQVWRDQPPILLSFTIGDLMRCKFLSKQKEVIKVLENIIQISDNYQKTGKQPKLKIIRIKNRLKSGTNDILINLNYHQKILCQVQLAIQSKQSKFVKYSNKFNHYIYEIQRSIMGPISQLSSICSSIDNRNKVYKKIKQDDYQKQISLASQIKSTRKTKVIHLPFICSICNGVYSHANYIKQHLETIQNTQKEENSIKICALCNLESQTESNILKFISKSIKNQNQKSKLQQKAIRKIDSIPQLGVCCKIQSQKIRIEYFQKIKSRQQSYLFGIEKKNIYLLTKIDKKSEINRFLKGYLIFQFKENSWKQIRKPLTESESRQKYIIPKELQTLRKKQKQALSLNENNLTEFPKEILKLNKLKNLKIQGNNKFEFVPVELFNLPNLERINLNGNKIKQIKISKNSYYITKLRYLYLFQTKLSKLPAQIGCLQKLQLLDLEKTQIQELPESICSITTLEYLYLTETNLKILPDSIGDLENLISLSLRQTKIKSLPQSIKKWKKLKNIDLSFTALQKFPQQLTECINLASLYLQYTQISEIPESISNLQNLQQISLKSTDIQKVPANMSQKITKISFSMTGLEQFPICLRQIHELLYLDLCETGITQIPDWISELQQLRALDINNTRVSQLPESICMLKNLNYLSIQNTSITKLPQKFQQLKGLLTFQPNKQLLNSKQYQRVNVFISNNLKRQQAKNKNQEDQIQESIIQNNPPIQKESIILSSPQRETIIKKQNQNFKKQEQKKKHVNQSQRPSRHIVDSEEW